MAAAAASRLFVVFRSLFAGDDYYRKCDSGSRLMWDGCNRARIIHDFLSISHHITSLIKTHTELRFSRISDLIGTFAWIFFTALRNCVCVFLR